MWVWAARGAAARTNASIRARRRATIGCSYGSSVTEDALPCPRGEDCAPSRHTHPRRPHRMLTTEKLNTSLAGRYVIEREIGAGGMATVYLARDVRHDRHVALKVLNPDDGWGRRAPHRRAPQQL